MAPPLTDASVTLSPAAMLAAAVIRQAVLDATSESINRLERERARSFLAGSDSLRAWCGVAGLPADVVTDYARQIMLDLPAPRLTAR
jgi:hypothetical protein